MNFDDYQQKAKDYDFFTETEDLTSPGFIEKVLGLAGETGETADKIKKLIRDKNGAVTSEDKTEITKELGDTLWYLAGIARYLNIPLSKVAEMNIDKLESRKTRGKLKGSGDNR